MVTVGAGIQGGDWEGQVGIPGEAAGDGDQSRAGRTADRSPADGYRRGIVEEAEIAAGIDGRADVETECVPTWAARCFEHLAGQLIDRRVTIRSEVAVVAIGRRVVQAVRALYPVRRVGLRGLQVVVLHVRERGQRAIGRGAGHAGQLWIEHSE